MYDLLGLLILIVDIAVIFEIMQSCREMPRKIMWTFFVLLFPLVGVICYFIWADRHAHRYVILV